MAGLKIKVFLENQPKKLQRYEISFDKMLNYNILGLLENTVFTETKKKNYNTLLKVILTPTGYTK